MGLWLQVWSSLAGHERTVNRLLPHISGAEQERALSSEQRIEHDVLRRARQSDLATNNTMPRFDKHAADSRKASRRRMVQRCCDMCRVLYAACCVVCSVSSMQQQQQQQQQHVLYWSVGFGFGVQQVWHHSSHTAHAACDYVWHNLTKHQQPSTRHLNSPCPAASGADHSMRVEC